MFSILQDAKPPAHKARGLGSSDKLIESLACLSDLWSLSNIKKAWANSALSWDSSLLVKYFFTFWLFSKFSAYFVFFLFIARLNLIDVW